MKVNNKIRKKLIDKKGFTEREVEVFFNVGGGESNAVVADELKITEGTVKFHLTNIFQKLGVKSRSSVLLKANGLEAV